MRIGNDFQLLTIVVKISEFLNPRVPEPTYDYQRWLLALLNHFWQVLGFLFNVSDRFWIDPKHVPDRFFFSLETKKIDPICLSDRTWYDMYQIHLGVEQ